MADDDWTEEIFFATGLVTLYAGGFLYSRLPLSGWVVILLSVLIWITQVLIVCGGLSWYLHISERKSHKR